MTLLDEFLQGSGLLPIRYSDYYVLAKRPLHRSDRRFEIRISRYEQSHIIFIRGRHSNNRTAYCNISFLLLVVISKEERTWFHTVNGAVLSFARAVEDDDTFLALSKSASDNAHARVFQSSHV